MVKIDCFGDICPIPILKIKKQLEITAIDESFMVVTDHSCVSASIEEFLKTSKTEYEIDEVMNGVWEIIITKH